MLSRTRGEQLVRATEVELAAAPCWVCWLWAEHLKLGLLLAIEDFLSG